MVLLIDANVILDVLMNLQDFVKDSSMIWKLCETEKAKGYVSALTFANLVYIMRKQLDPEAIENIYRKLGLIFTFTDLSVSDLTRAAELNWSDFEDAVQSVTAERIHADYIITRNVRDFSKSKIMAFTPSELLARIWNGVEKERPRSVSPAFLIPEAELSSGSVCVSLALLLIFFSKSVSFVFRLSVLHDLSRLAVQQPT